MSKPWPIYCAYGDGRHHASYRVESQYREVVTCATHLAQAKRWAGPNPTTTPLHANTPPPPEQPPLF